MPRCKNKADWCSVLLHRIVMGDYCNEEKTSSPACKPMKCEHITACRRCFVYMHLVGIQYEVRICARESEFESSLINLLSEMGYQ
jgi:hypothetical protein